MKNSFKVNYDTKTILLSYQDEEFTFDLNEGDIGEFWNSFKTKEGIIKDINFAQESANEKPGLSVYPIGEDGYINTSEEEPIDCALTEGNPINYFGSDEETNQEHISAVLENLKKRTNEIDNYLCAWFSNLPLEAQEDIMGDYGSPDQSDYTQTPEGIEEYNYDLGEYTEKLFYDFSRASLDIKLNDFKKYAEANANSMAPGWDFVGYLF